MLSGYVSQKARVDDYGGLKTLRTDYLDIYLLHRNEPSRLVEEIIDSLQEITDEGTV